jgi:polyphosphate kinase 2 (PPK2 family)
LFDTAELGQSIPKAEFKKRELGLRASLLKLQYQALEMARFPIIIDFAGVDGAGKGTTMNMLDKWMDPRWIRAIGYQPPSEEEKARPRFWRYWRDIPPKGRMGVYLSGRYSGPLLQRVYGEIDDAEFDDRLAEIIRFENTLADDGALILKFWMHLSRDAQKERLEALSADPMLSYKVKDNDWRNHEHYDKFIDAAEKIITRTNRAAAPWTIVEGVDPYYRHMRVGETIRAELERHLAIHENSPANSSPGKPEPHQTGQADSLQPLTIFDNLDLSVRFTDGKYPKKKKKLQAKLGELGRKAHEQGQSTVLVFEGPDAAGKGGAIRRTVWSLDARTYRIYQFAAPTDIERAHHYLWRFWSKLPKAGNVSVGVSGPNCRKPATCPCSTGAGTAGSSSNAPKVLPPRTSGAGRLARSTTSRARSSTGASCCSSSGFTYPRTNSSSASRNERSRLTSTGSSRTRIGETVSNGISTRLPPTTWCSLRARGPRRG